jgi:hypothetical protein
VGAASWRRLLVRGGFVLEELVRRVGERFVFFWATHGGAELDLLVNRGTTRLGFEVKWGDAPRPTRSMHVALEDLRLERLGRRATGCTTASRRCRSRRWATCWGAEQGREVLLAAAPHRRHH